MRILICICFNDVLYPEKIEQVVIDEEEAEDVIENVDTAATEEL